MKAYEDYLISVMESRPDEFDDINIIHSRYKILTSEYRQLEKIKTEYEDQIEQERSDMIQYTND